MTFFVAAFLSAIIVLVSTASNIYQSADRKVNWRSHEYAILEGLKAGFSTSRFDSELGAPAFVRPSKNRRFVEKTYQRRDYWVQTVSTRDGTTQLYTVTSCDQSFRPSFEAPAVGTVKLRDTRFAEMTKAKDSAFGVRLDYFIPGATANARFLDLKYGANPGNYKTYAWGIVDACADFYLWFGRAFKQHAIPFGPRTSASQEMWSKSRYEYAGSLEKSNRWIRRFRRREEVNTYAETAPLADVSAIRSQFQIGPDRILTRTTWRQGG